MEKPRLNDYGSVYVDGVKIGTITKPIKLTPKCRISYAITATAEKVVFPKKQYSIEN